MQKKKDTFVKTLDRMAKRWLAKSFLAVFGPVNDQIQFEGPIQSVIILAQEKMGDAILLTPLIGLLRSTLPDIEIHVVTYSSIYRFFKDDVNIQQVHRGKNHYWSFYKAIWGKRFDVLYSTKDHFSFTFVYQARLIPARFE